MMRYFLLALLLSFGCAKRTTPIAQSEDQNIQVDVTDWTGPGLYYGIWFNNEADYNNWQRNHNNNWNQNRNDNNRRANQGPERDGGQRGGRAGGGGHR